MPDIKIIALHRNAFELLQEFKKWDNHKAFSSEISQIEPFLKTIYAKHRHHYTNDRLMRENQLEYAKGILLHFTRILTYFRVFPSEENIKKFKLGALVDQGESFSFVSKLHKETQGIKSLLSFKPVTNNKDHWDNYYLEIYVTLINTLRAMKFTIKGNAYPRDMELIIKHNLVDISNLCGFFECWKLRPMSTVRFINKQISKIGYRYE